MLLNIPQQVSRLKGSLRWVMLGLSLLLWGCPPSNNDPGGGGNGTPNAVSPTRVIESRPNIRQSGRITVLARQIASETTFLAGGETGGMFRTTDKGVTWAHVDAFPALKVTDIEFFTPQIVMATAMADFHSDGPWAYRSTDGGLTWQPCTVEPKAWGPLPFEAYSITQAKSLEVFVLVATSYGIVRSKDFGVTWKWVYPLGPEESMAFGAVEAYGKQVYAAGPEGMHFSTDYGQTWTMSTTELRGGRETGHAIAISPLNFKHAFFADQSNRLHSTTDGGVTWTLVPTPSEGSRPAFVRIGLAQQGISMLYFGEGKDFFRRKVEWKMQGFTFKTNWEKVEVAHVDPCDIAFAEDGFTPVLMSSDGGVFNTADGGRTWQYIGTGPQGLHALQIMDLTGQIVSGAKLHTDLYIGTQDNQLHASTDGGATWPIEIGSEGYNTQAERRSYDHMGVHVIGVNCAKCSHYISKHHFMDHVGFHNASDGAEGGPPDFALPLLLPDGSLLQWVNPDDGDLPWRVMRSIDWGNSWTEVGAWMLKPSSPAVVAGDPENPVLYQMVTVDVDNGFERKLACYTGLTRGNGRMVLRDIATPAWGRMQFRSFTVLKGGGNRGNVLILNPSNLDYVQMSVDSGKTWWDAKELTRAATDNGKYVLKSANESFISAIAWDPEAPCQILVGTMQNGIIRSVDGGHNWAKIPDSEQILFPSSFFFYREDSVAVSTFGRGFWIVDLGDRPRECQELRPPIQIVHNLEDYVVTVDNGQHIDLDDYSVAAHCKDCDLFSLRGGGIAGVKTKAGKVEAIAVTGGVSEIIPARGLPSPIPVRPSSRTRAAVGRTNTTRLPALQPGERITGIYLRDQAIVAYRVSVPGRKAAAKDPMPQLALLRNGKPVAMDMVEMGRPLEISGKGFELPPSPKVVLRIEGTPDSLLVAPRRTGGISTTWAVPLRPGHYTLTATQTNKGTHRIAELDFFVPRFEGSGK